MLEKPGIEIEYCTQCKFLLRAAWVAHELLTAFQDRVGKVVLIPGSSGVFEIRVDGETLYSRKETHIFAESKELKRMLRDRIAA
ncbi:MAG: SelT/SelW/SelH family protein [Acidiferrobacterales bacterium]